MGLIDELEQIDKKFAEKQFETKEVEEREDRKKKTEIVEQLKRSRRYKKIIDAVDPSLDQPILCRTSRCTWSKGKFERTGDGWLEFDRSEWEGFLSKRMIRLIQLDNDEEWKVKVEKLNRNLTQGEKLTKEKIQEKVRTIYSSEKGKERCLMSLIMPGEPSWFKGIKLDTKLGNALLVKVFKEDMVGDIDLSPEKLEEFDRMRIEAEKSNLSLISFSTIKSAIKEHLLGKGER